MDTTTKPDVFGEALSDYFYDKQNSPLLLHTSYGTIEDMPVDWFFREEEDFPPLELEALHACRGSVLDIGAGVGSHALYLQERGLTVTALEISPQAAWIMSERGVRHVHCMPYQEYKGKKFDTLLLLMNGIGIIGRLPSLPSFLQHMQQLLRPGGQLLFDSSDIHYLYQDHPLPEASYYGEVRFQFEYRGQKGEWFDWLYIDPSTLLNRIAPLGWQGEILFTDPLDQYLVRLTPDD